MTLIDKAILGDLLEPLDAGERLKVLDEVRTQLETLRVFLLQKQDLVTSSTVNGHKNGADGNGSEAIVKTSTVIVKHDSAKENGVTTTECSGGHTPQSSASSELSPPEQRGDRKEVKN